MRAQVPYSLLNRDIERELLPMAESQGMSVAAWGALDVVLPGEAISRLEKATGFTPASRPTS